MKRPTVKTYVQGLKDGFAEGKREGRAARDAERVYRSPDYWNWQEWVVYVGSTVGAAITAILIFWLVGCFIRWEVGPIPQPWAAIGTTNGTVTIPRYQACSFGTDGIYRCP